MAFVSFRNDAPPETTARPPLATDVSDAPVWPCNDSSVLRSGVEVREGNITVADRSGLCLGVMLVFSGVEGLGCVPVSDNPGELPHLGETVMVVLILDLRSGVVGFEAVSPGLWEKEEKTADGISSSRSSPPPEECRDGDRLGVENAEDRAGDNWKESPADGAIISGETPGNSGLSTISADSSISNCSSWLMVCGCSSRSL